mmetsp:Transcript_38279/g.36633  ORF Transcript_38279/g.36633 Transcript_38279/m.36633 type:complete len:149 (-) Transcript_38279:347-793(-)
MLCENGQIVSFVPLCALIQIITYISIIARSGINQYELLAVDSTLFNRFAIFDREYIVKNGHWELFITPLFVHQSVAMLMLNISLLFIIGYYMERYYHSVEVGLIYFVGSFGGMMATIFSKSPEVYLTFIPFTAFLGAFLGFQFYYWKA